MVILSPSCCNAVLLQKRFFELSICMEEEEMTEFIVFGELFL